MIVSQHCSKCGEPFQSKTLVNNATCPNCKPSKTLRPFEIQYKWPGGKFLTIPGCVYATREEADEALAVRKSTQFRIRGLTTYRIIDIRKCKNLPDHTKAYLAANGLKPS